MAVRFSRSSSEYWSLTTGLPAGNSDFTWMAWVYPISYHSSNWSAIFSPKINGVDCELAFDAGSGARKIALWNGSTDLTSSGTYAAGSWYHIALTKSSGTATAYVNGTSVVTQTGGNAWPNTGTTAGYYIGEWSGGGDYFDGRMCALKMWTRALTAAEIQQEIYANRPISTTSLFFWIPAVATGAGSRNIDYSGNGKTFTETNTPTDEDNPPITWGSNPRQFIFVPTVAGTLYYQTITQSAALTTYRSHVVNTTKANPVIVAESRYKTISIPRNNAVTVTETRVKLFPPITISQLVTGVSTLSKTATKAVTQVVTGVQQKIAAIGKTLAHSVTIQESRTKKTIATKTQTVTITETETKRIDKVLAYVVTLVTLFARLMSISKASVLNATTTLAKNIAKIESAISSVTLSTEKTVAKTISDLVTSLVSLGTEVFVGLQYLTINSLVVLTSAQGKLVIVIKDISAGVIDSVQKTVKTSISSVVTALTDLATQIINGVQFLTLNASVAVTETRQKIVASVLNTLTTVVDTYQKTIVTTRNQSVAVTTQAQKQTAKIFNAVVASVTDTLTQRLGGIDPSTIVGSGGIYYYNENVFVDSSLTDGCLVGGSLGGWSPVAGILPAFTQNTGTKKPTRTVSGIYFDGTSDAMSFSSLIPNAQSRTVMMIGSHPALSTTTPLFSAGAANWYVGAAGGSSLNGRMISSRANSANTQITLNVAPAGLFDSSEHLYVWKHETTGTTVTMTHWKDATQANSRTDNDGMQASSNTTWALGGFTTTSLYGQWKIKALAIFPFALTDEQRLGILTYWALKYGTPNFTTLVLSHVTAMLHTTQKIIQKQLQWAITAQTALESLVNVTVSRAMRFHAVTVSIADKAVKSISMAIRRRLKRF